MERVAALAEQFLRPMVERAAREEEARAAREAAGTGEYATDAALFPVAIFATRQVRPVCVGDDTGDGEHYLYCDDGTRYYVKDGEYLETDAVPGSPRAAEQATGAPSRAP